MPYDEALADRIRDVLTPHPGLTEQKMFGGLGFMLFGHLTAAAASNGNLLLRVDPAHTEALLDDDVRRFEMRGRARNGWLDVPAQRVVTAQELASWIAHGVAYVSTLPANEPKRR